MTHPTSQDLVCIGAVAGAHGVRGRVKVKSFTQEPGDFFSFERIFSEDGSKEYNFLTASSNGKGLFVSHVEGVDTREQAESLRSTKFYALKSDFPDLEAEDEFYYSDLIGLEVKLGNDDVLGQIKTVQNHGAGDVLEVALKDSSDIAVLPFSGEMIPEVNVKQGYVLANKDLAESYLAAEKEGDSADA